MFCWLAFSENEYLKMDLQRVGFFIPADGKPTAPSRLYPAAGRETTLRRTPLGGPKDFAGQHLENMKLVKGTGRALEFYSMPRENRQFHLEFTPRTAVKHPSAAPLSGGPKIFCWLAFGKHEALKGDWKGVVVLFHAEGKPTIPSRLYPNYSMPRENRQFHLDFTPRTAVKHPSAAPLRDAHRYPRGLLGPPPSYSNIDIDINYTLVDLS